MTSKTDSLRIVGYRNFCQEIMIYIVFWLIMESLVEKKNPSGNDILKPNPSQQVKKLLSSSCKLICFNYSSKELSGKHLET